VVMESIMIMTLPILVATLAEMEAEKEAGLGAETAAAEEGAGAEGPQDAGEEPESAAGEEAAAGAEEASS